MWQSTVPLRHIYTLDIKAARTRGGETVLGHRGGPASADPALAVASPLRARINQVWHQLELTNNGKIPWTTGAALTPRSRRGMRACKGSRQSTPARRRQFRSK